MAPSLPLPPPPPPPADDYAALAADAEARGLPQLAADFRAKAAAEPKVVRAYEVLGTPEGIALRPMPVEAQDAPTRTQAAQGAPAASGGPAPASTTTDAPQAPAPDLEELRLGVERARAQVAAAEEEAKRIVGETKAALRAAQAVYKEACRSSGKAPALVGGRTRSANVSEKVRFLVSIEGEHVHISVEGRSGAEERLPIEQVRASINKTAAAFCDAHLGPKSLIGNKMGSLSNRLRALLGKPANQ